MRSQMSLEFLVGVSILLIIYVGVLGLYSHFSQKVILEKETAKELCYKLSTAINAGAVGSNGFTMNFSIPYRLGLITDYFYMTHNSSLITVDWPNGVIACSIITQNVTARNVVAGKIAINNVNGEVFVSSLYTEKREYNVGESINVSGYYFPGNVSLNLLIDNTQTQGYPVVIETTEGYFEKIIDTSITGSGEYHIIARSIENKDFYADRMVYVR